MKITCDTDIGELIKVSDVDKEFSELSNDMKPILVYSNVLKKETYGSRGLSKQALSIEGKSYINNKTIKQLGNLEDFYSSYSSSKSSLVEAATRQRKKELLQLKTAVETKIAELNSSINNLNSLLNPGFESPVLEPAKKTMYKIQLKTNQKSLIQYKKKLKLVESELGGV